MINVEVVGGREGEASGEEEVEENAECPDVDGGTERDEAGEDFRSGVVERTACSLDGETGMIDGRKSPVTYANVAGSIEQNVFGFDVPVDHKMSVTIRQSRNYLHKQTPHFLLPKLSSLLIAHHVLKQIASCRVFHNQRQFVLRFDHLQQPHHIRVIQTRHHLRLRLDTITLHHIQA